MLIWISMWHVPGLSLCDLERIRGCCTILCYRNISLLFYSMAEQPPSMVRDHIIFPGLVAKLPQHTEGFKPSSQRPPHTDLYQCLKHRLGCSFRSRLNKRSDKQKTLHKNLLELKAVFLALKQFTDQCQNQTVLIATHNSIVVAYTNRKEPT